MITLHTLSGIVEVDPATITDAELDKLGLTREWADKQVVDEAEQRAMEKAEAMIDSISNLAGAKVFLKKLCLRLFKNGALP